MGSLVSGEFGNRYGRWIVILVGMLIQGLFFGVWPKELLWIQVISFAGLGFGMGVVDGCAPALLGAFL